jgi:hypothetical protein
MEYKKFNETHQLLDTLIGKSLQQAIDLCKFNGYSIKSSTVHNVGQRITLDFRFDSINVKVKDNIIIEAHIG